MSGTAQQHLQSLAQPWVPAVRLLVSVGNCGVATGAGEIAEALRREAARRNATLSIVEAGCPGLCHANVMVTLQRPGGADLTWPWITSEQVPQLIEIALGQQQAGSLPDGWAWSTEESDDLPGIGAMPFLARQSRCLLRHAGRIDPIDLDEACARGRYAGLARALDMPRETLIGEVEDAGVTGRGGAYFPIARKWRGCLAGGDPPRYLVVNAEEGEPGVFKDRHLLESDPHLVIEGLLIAAYAIEAERVFVFVNGLATLTSRRLREALEAARERGLIGERILGSDFSCDVDIRSGAGGYVLGEESVILEAIEGQRPMPRVRPPFPVIDGLWGRPTDINNVETLANVAMVLELGVESYRRHGTSAWPGTKLVCVTGDVARPGMVEIEIGAALRTVVEELAGGVPAGRPLQAVLTGGPSGVLTPPQLLDTPLEPRRTDALLGSGNVVVFDDRHDLLDIVRRLAWFNAEESCGKCTPCREGTHRMAEILDRVAAGHAQPSDRADLLALCDIAAHASICGLGQMAPNPVRSGLLQFSLRGLEEGAATWQST